MTLLIVIATSDPIDASVLTTAPTATDHLFTFPTTPILSSATKYWFVINVVSVSSFGTVQNEISSAGSVVASEGMSTSTDSGSTWSAPIVNDVIAKIEGSGKKHAHKIQAAIAMEQRAKEMGKTAEARVYRAYIEKMKKITQQRREK